ncbi:hypothetical protein E4U13_001830 [Claviceps humidiphila]|uniref:Uncharacterized protein n=1 Tax=Claviceps humidiphila TaxID=1294629 RepID=A0A9P7Q0X3_9HYPO|nr:hypothetical protein E4U13_001830 [Claviceps humidiphila]
MPAPVEIQKATLSKFIDAWERWNADDFIGLWSDSFTFKVLPFSDEKPTRPRDKIGPMYRNFIGTLTNYKAIFISFSEGGDKIETLEEVNDNAFRKEWDPKCHAYWGYGKPPKAKEVAGC